MSVIDAVDGTHPAAVNRIRFDRRKVEGERYEIRSDCVARYRQERILGAWRRC